MTRNQNLSTDWLATAPGDQGTAAEASRQKQKVTGARPTVETPVSGPRAGDLLQLVVVARRSETILPLVFHLVSLHHPISFIFIRICKRTFLEAALPCFSLFYWSFLQGTRVPSPFSTPRLTPSSALGFREPSKTELGHLPQGNKHAKQAGPVTVTAGRAKEESESQKKKSDGLNRPKKRTPPDACLTVAFLQPSCPQEPHSCRHRSNDFRRPPDDPHSRASTPKRPAAGM